MDGRTKKIIEELERERGALFRKFIEFTDLAERYNEKAFDISCQIERINLTLREAEDLGIINPGRNPGSDGLHVSHVPRRFSEEEEEKIEGEPPGGDPGE